MTRILAISDEIADALYQLDFNSPLRKVDVLLGCGDLPYRYMDTIVTRVQTPHAYYVHGNHDEVCDMPYDERHSEPNGWMNIDNRSRVVGQHNLIVAGLEGSICYQPHQPYQYTELAMSTRARLLMVNLLLNRVRFGRYLDILIAHAPALGIHDSQTGAHRGFQVFLAIIRRFQPRLFLHGHVHRYGPTPWHSRYHNTEVVNVFPFRFIKLDAGAVHFERSTQDMDFKREVNHGRLLNFTA